MATIPPSPATKPIYRRWWFIALVVVVGVVILAGLFGDDPEEVPGALGTTTTTSGADTTAPATNSIPASTSSIAVSSTSVATTTTTQPPTTTTAPPVPSPEPTVLTGSGPEVIEFEADLVSWLTDSVGVFEYSVSGSGNNAVWALDPDFEETDLLVNTIGDHTGRRWLGLSDTPSGLSIEVGAGWEFTISPFTSVSPVSSAEDFNVQLLDTTGTYPGAETPSITGIAPDAIAIKTDGQVAEVEANGDGNIAIWVYSTTTGEAELLVNEIDTFSGSGLLPDCTEVCVVDMDGDFEYTITIRE